MHLSIGIPVPVSVIVLGMATKTDRTPSPIGRRIIAARKAMGLSQAAFAKELGIKQSSMSNLEIGPSNGPSAETLLAMRDRGVNPDYIMRGRGPMLIDKIERKLENDAVLAMMDEFDDAERQSVIQLMRILYRQRGKKGPSDPFLLPPPRKPKDDGS